MGGSSNQGTQTTQSDQTSTTSLPPWVNQAAQQNYAFAQQVANQPLQQYQGQMVASVSPQMQQAWNLAAQGGAAGSDAFNSAMGGYLNTMGQQLTPVTAQNMTAALNQGSQNVTPGSLAALQGGGVIGQPSPSWAGGGGGLQRADDPGYGAVPGGGGQNAAAAMAAAMGAPGQTGQQGQAAQASQQITPSGPQGIAGPLSGQQGIAGPLSQTGQQGGMPPGGLSAYMNPYTNQVINTALPLMQQQLGQTQSGIGGQAASANAFGGSRQGVQQGVAQSQGALNEAQLAAQLQQANYGQAVGQAQYDISNRLQAGLANQQQQNQMSLANQQMQQQANQQNAAAANAAQSTNLQAALSQMGLTNQAASGLSGLGYQQNLQQAQDFTQLEQAGAQQQLQAQNEINANMAKFQQAWSYPQQQLGTLLSAMGMTPYGQSTSSAGESQTTQTAPNNTAGALLGGVQALSSLFSGGAGGGLMSGLSSLFGGSDERLKTDITPLGKDKETGLQMHAFRYKGDPKSYPKVVGPMAQEVEKKYPRAVIKTGAKGMRAINPAAILQSANAR